MVNILEYLFSLTKKIEVLEKYVLCLFAFLIFFFAVFCFQRIIGVLFNLFLDHVLKNLGYHRPMCKSERKPLHTDTCTPDRFKACISSIVSGCTKSPSLISSLVASVSSIRPCQETAK